MPWLALALPLGAALLLTRALWWNRSDPPAPAVLLVALGLGGGLGLAAYTYALALLVAGGRAAVCVALDAALLVAAAFFVRHRRASHRRRAGAPWHGGDLLLLAVVLAAALAAITAFAANASLNPHGEWDAWAIWNFRARFLFRAGPDWPRAFSPELMHADYPPLLPSVVAHAWTYAGNDGSAVPLGVALAFTAALVMLLAGALAHLRGRTPALLAVLCLLATPVLLQSAAWQYADIPLAFFLLATLAMIAVADRQSTAAQTPSDAGAVRGGLALAGGAAGMAAWTKNEGAVMVLAVVLVRILWAARSGGIDGRRATAFTLGLAPGALLLAGFKLVLAPSGYLFAEQHAADYLARLVDPARYAIIASASGGALTSSLSGLTVSLPLAAVLLGRTGERASRQGAAWIGCILALIVLGYLGVYLITPLDLTWQLHHSLDRLILQLWPSALFALFLFTASPEERRPRPEETIQRRPSRPRRQRQPAKR